MILAGKSHETRISTKPIRPVSCAGAAIPTRPSLPDGRMGLEGSHVTRVLELGFMSDLLLLDRTCMSKSLISDIFVIYNICMTLDYRGLRDLLSIKSEMVEKFSVAFLGFGM